MWVFVCMLVCVCVCAFNPLALEIFFKFLHTLYLECEAVSCPAQSCDVRMLWAQYTEVHRSAQCEACFMLVHGSSEHPHVLLFSTQIPTQNTYNFSVFRSVLLNLIHFVWHFIAQSVHMQCKFVSVNELFVHFSVGTSGWPPYQCAALWYGRSSK
jgi:hypothetical protein